MTKKSAKIAARLLAAALALLLCLNAGGQARAAADGEDFVRRSYYELVLSRSWLDVLRSPDLLGGVGYSPEAVMARGYLCDLDGDGTEELVLTGQASMAECAYTLYTCTQSGARLLSIGRFQGDSAVLACPEAGTLRFAGYHGGWSVEHILQLRDGRVTADLTADGEGEIAPESLDPGFAGDYVRLEGQSLEDLRWLYPAAESDVNAAALRLRDESDPADTIPIGADFLQARVPAWWAGHFFLVQSEPWKLDVIHVDIETGYRYWLFSLGLSDTVHDPEQISDVVPEDWYLRGEDVTWSDMIRCLGTWSGGLVYALEPESTGEDFAAMDALTQAMTECVWSGEIFDSVRVNEEAYYSFGLYP